MPGTADSVPSYQAGWQRCLAVFSTSAACSNRRPLWIASSAHQPLWRFRPSFACQSPARSVLGLRLPDTPVCCGCRPFQKSLSMCLSVSLGSRMMDKDRTQTHTHAHTYTHTHTHAHTAEEHDLRIAQLTTGGC